MQAMQRNPTLVLPSEQRLHKLQFLQELGCQKPCWDQARLSSLVNKQVGAGAGDGLLGQISERCSGNLQPAGGQWGSAELNLLASVRGYCYLR